MIIRGILDNSLNGQLCIRGFAPIKELARISRADYSYQRDPLERDDITDFLETQTYLFFPELILSYKIKHSFDDGKDAPLESILNKNTYKSSIDKTQIKIKPVDYKQIKDLSGKNQITLVELILDDSLLDEFISKNEHPFHRIDGNHRLLAAEKTTSPKVERMAAPFCIILGVEYYENNIIQELEDSITFNKATKVFFHNINTKTIPLTSEENLKVLIDDEKNCIDEELENIFGGLYPIKTRKLIKKAPPSFFSGIEHIIKDNYRTYYNDVFKKLLEKGEDPSKVVGKVFESLKAIDLLYKETDSLKANSSFGLLTAFLYYHSENNRGKFELFKRWVINNQLFNIDEIKADSIIKIFNKIAEQKITIFIAMPYFSEDEVKAHNEAYRRVIEDIKKENSSIDITHYEIMTHEGSSVEMIQDILNKIDDCKIFIANITGNNANVTYEMGWARALKKPIILVREEASEEPKSDYKMLYHASYKEKALITLEDVVKKNIIAILKNEYGYVL